ncbi:hypothetical protein [Paraburkholderia sp. BCC1885]|uniref:hypothetical protein n=1 Tax=Paraburkholderia sp. BCC1885 TaxID=2562669 RepID=UPI00118328C4|nr:hypothetical protein [Paraburkholderia sp. BCC1885]
MKYDSSNAANGGSNGSRPDVRAEIQPAVQSTPEVRKTPAPVRNWAWAHNTESYDWMDSHSPSSTRDSFH